jgi:thiamine biosynthesis lipoprotein
MNRRDFLHPRLLAHAAGQVLGALEEPLAAPPVIPDLSLLHLSHRAMATTWTLILPFGTPSAAQIAEEAFTLLDDLETQLTVYRDTSEVSQLNRVAPYAAVPVESCLFTLLEQSARIHQETEGAFDITAGALIKAWGFFRGPRRVPDETEIQAALERVGMDKVRLERGSRSVRFLQPGLEINLGSIGKGYALDRLAQHLADEWNLPASLLHGGHSSVYARGYPADDPRGWPIGVRHPWDPERRLATVWLRDRAVGTSAATFQYLEHQGRKLGHILDPRRGWPAEGVASVSVLAPTAAEADALATAFFVLGEQGMRAYCARHPEVGAIMLPEGPDARPIVCNLGPAEMELGEPLQPEST